MNSASIMNDIEQAVAMHLPAAQKGDRQAFAALVGATQNTVTSLALAVVRDVQHSEDIAQEAYLTVWKRLKTLRNPESFLPWLRQITRNLARDHLRRSRTRPGDAPGNEDGASEIERSVQGGSDGEAAALADERDRVIRDALDAMPGESREVLTLFYREGQSSKQVAKLLGLSDAAVRKRLSRARTGLRSELEARLGDSLRSSVPGIAFTTLVGSLLTTASPPAAAAVAFATTAKAGGKLVLGASLGLLLGLLGGIAGVVMGLRPHIRTSTNAEELAALKRVRAVGIGLVVFAVAGFAISAQLPGWLPATLVYVLFMTALGIQHFVILPRILAPRLAEQRRTDPDAARQQRRSRIWARVGMIGGGMSGLAGLIAGLVNAGRIAF